MYNFVCQLSLRSQFELMSYNIEVTLRRHYISLLHDLCHDVHIFDIYSVEVLAQRVIDVLLNFDESGSTATNTMVKRTVPDDEGGLCPQRKHGPFFMDVVA